MAKLKKQATPAAARIPAPPAPDHVREPLYRRVMSALRDDILRGLYPAGCQLPSEGELATRFSVSRHTVREALRYLRNDGLISSRQGAGTTVAQPSAPGAYVQEIQSINDLIHYAATIRYRVGRTQFVVSDARLASQIGGEVGQKWLRIEGLRYKEDRDTPICRTTVYVQPEYAGVGRLAGRRQQAIYELIEDLYGVQIGEVEQAVMAYRAPEEVAQELGLEADAVIIEVKRIYRTLTRKVAQVAVNQYRADQFTLTMTLRRSAP